jgi:hypothetical protein
LPPRAGRWLLANATEYLLGKIERIDMKENVNLERVCYLVKRLKELEKEISAFSYPCNVVETHQYKELKNVLVELEKEMYIE